MLNNGKVVGKGEHLELLNSCEVYREIVKSQLSDKEYKAELRLAEKFVAKHAEHDDAEAAGLARKVEYV